MSGLEHSQKAPLQRAVSDLERAFLVARRSALLLLTKLDRLAQFQRLAVLWAMGSVALALVTFVCFWLGLNFAATAFVFLIVIVFLSLLDSFISSALFSVIAIGCLNFFFVEPLYTFEVGDAQDLIALAAFLIASLAVTGLVRRVRSLGEVRNEQARLLDLITDAVFVRDRGDVITYWNRGAEQLYGWKREDAIGKVTHQLLQTVFPAPLAEITETLSRTGRWEGELLHMTRDGTQVSVASRWSRQRDQRGLPIGTLESNTDITERKWSEDALQRSQAAYVTEAQRLSHTGSFGWNASSGEIFWSDETFSIFGYEPTIKPSVEVVLQRVHPDDLALVRQVINRAAGDKQDFDFEHRLQMPDGSVKHLHVVARALANGPENLQFAGAVMDVTARKETERALRRSERRYQNLFQAMAVSFFEVDYTNSRQMLRALRDAGVVDFRRYFRENPGFVREIMRATHVVEVNDQAVALFGRGSKEELLTSGGTFWPEESIQDYVESVLASIDRNQGFSAETRMRKLDGTIFDAHFTAWYAPEETAKGLVGVIDITARKQAFLALERSEQRYRHLFNYMPIALAQLDARGLVELLKGLRAEGVTDLGPYFDAHPDFLRRCMDALIITEANERMVQFHGLRAASELVGTSVSSAWRERPDTFRRAMESRFNGITTFEEETKMTTRDGRTVDVLFTASRVGPIGDLGISLIGFMDISQRVQAFLALEKSEQRYRHLFHSMPLALWQLNGQRLGDMFRELRAQGVNDLSAYIDDHPGFVSDMIDAMVVEEVNDYAVKMFGARDRNELLGPTHWLWAKNTDTPRRAFEGRWRGREFFQETTKLATRDGRVIDALYTVARPRLDAGLPIAFATMIDLTEQVRAQTELQQVRADFAHAARISMLGELTASIAHEINQPLAAIAAGGEAGLRWLARPTPNVDEVRELTKSVVADARRASEIIARIRTMATRRAPEQELLLLDDVIREALLFLRHEVQSRGAMVSHFPATAAPKVFADRTQLQQVIVNLAVNAMQAIEHAGSSKRNIAIRTVAHDPASLRCSVEDSGPGIEAQHISRLFDSFFTTKDSGMGMGLRICRSVVEAHGGRIGADNESSLGGARFYFTVPVATART